MTPKRYAQLLRKPPVGILPQWLWLERRVAELAKAVKRYKAAKQEIPTEWREELRSHRAALADVKKKNRVPDKRTRQSSNRILVLRQALELATRGIGKPHIGAPCHVGIVPLKECARCQRAAKIYAALEQAQKWTGGKP